MSHSLILFFILAFQQTVDSRAPFAIELPELDTGLLHAATTTDVFIPPGRAITRFRLWVLNPYAGRIGSRISARLSNQSLGIVGQTGSGRYGNYFEVDLRQNPDLHLSSGQNVIEVMAEERDPKLIYRCSFVLWPGTAKPPKPDCDRIGEEVRTDYRLVPIDPGRPLNDRVAPQIILTEPSAMLATTGAPLTVRVAGEATDENGRVVAVTVNGQTLAASPRPGPRAGRGRAAADRTVDPLKFDQMVTIPAETRALIIEAQDQAGNRTLITVPVINRNCADAVPVADSGGRKLALLVGVSNYRYHEGGLNDLQFADADALAVRAWLKTAGGGAFKDGDIECLTNDGATLAAVESAVDRFLTRAGENDLIYLFLAGHGAPDPDNPQRLYFLLHDSKVTDLPHTAFPMDRMGEILKRQRKRVRLIAFFDTRRRAGIQGQPAPRAPRGVGAGRTGAGDAPAPGFNFYNAALFKQQGWTIITSSGMNEQSEEGRHWGGGHGVFTWALLEGLQGKADADRDCRVTAAELAPSTTATVGRRTGNRQHPQSLLGGRRDLVVATVPDAACRGAVRK